MAENIKIKVQTPMGTTEEENVGCIVGQGTNEGNVLSSVSIDGGVKEKFHMDGNISVSKEPDEPEKELKYGNIEIKPVIFMDDLLNASKSVETAQHDNIKMEEIIEEKLL